MSEQQPPKIEFPCPDYPIKVIGEAFEGFEALVIEIVQQHASGLDASQVTIQPSSKGTFVSIRFKITATGVPQLESIHQDLLASGKVKMVL